MEANSVNKIRFIREYISVHPRKIRAVNSILFLLQTSENKVNVK